MKKASLLLLIYCLFAVLENPKWLGASSRLDNLSEESPILEDLGDGTTRFVIPAENSDDSFPVKSGRKGAILKEIKTGDTVKISIESITGRHRQFKSPVHLPQLSVDHNPVCTAWGEPPVREVLDPDRCLDWNQHCVVHSQPCIREERRCVEIRTECCKRERHCPDPTNNHIISQIHAFGCFWECVENCTRCVREEPICLERTEKCEAWAKSDCRSYATKLESSGPAPCIQTQNQWLKVYELSQLASRIDKTEEIQKFDLQSVFNGLVVEFSTLIFSDGKTHRTSSHCSLVGLNAKLIPQETTILFRFKLEDTDQCKLMVGAVGDDPTYEIYLINQLSRPETFSCGFLHEQWNGNLNYRCPQTNESSDVPILSTYFPRYSVTGSVKIISSQSKDENL